MIKRLDIILGLKDKFNFNAFTTACFEADVPSMSLTEYCQKIGMLHVALVRYPGDEPFEAYMKVVDEMNEAAGAPTRQNPTEQKKPCGTCGGKSGGGGSLE
jgi:hypothetical protein